MALSYVTYAGDGSTTNFTYDKGYLQTSDVSVYLDGVLQTITTDYSWFSSTVIQFVTPPGSGVVVKIARSTQNTSRVVDFQDAANLTESDLDTSADQMFYLAQEGLDNFTDNALTLDTDDKWDAASKVIKNVTDPTNAQDAATKAYGEANWGGAAAAAAEAAQTAAETAQTAAETAQSNAESAETGALNAQTATAAIYDQFDDRYLGSKASDPTLDNDGNPLQTGALYWNSATPVMRVYNGSAWEDIQGITEAYADTLYAPINNYFGKNLLQNGGMAIHQRQQTLTHNSWTYDCNLDRWVNSNDMASAAWQSTQSQNSRTSSPKPLMYYGHLTCSTADTTPGVAETASYKTAISSREGWATLKCGTAEAATVTLSFWHAHTQPGTWSIAIRNVASPVDRSYVAEYTQSVADTWEKSEITIQMDTDTSADWGPDYPADARYLYVEFCLRVGTTHSTSTLNTWQNGNYTGSTNQVNFFSSTSNHFRLGEVQLELGDTATEFEYFGGTTFTDYQACQQYFQRITGGPIGHGWAASTTSAAIKVGTDVKMRGGNPTLYYTSGSATTLRLRGNGNAGVAVTTEGTHYVVTGGVDLYLNVASGLVANETYHLNDNGATVFIRSEI